MFWEVEKNLFLTRQDFPLFLLALFYLKLNIEQYFINLKKHISFPFSLVEGPTIVLISSTFLFEFYLIKFVPLCYL